MARHYSPPGTFEAIRKEVIEDPTWTLAAFRLALYLTAKPDGWVLHAKPLADGTGLKPSTVEAGIRELRRRGLVYDEQVRNDQDGRFERWETRFRRNLVVAPPSTPPKNRGVDTTGADDGPKSSNHVAENPQVVSTPAKNRGVVSTPAKNRGVGAGVKPLVTDPPGESSQVGPPPDFSPPREKIGTNREDGLKDLDLREDGPQPVATKTPASARAHRSIVDSSNSSPTRRGKRSPAGPDVVAAKPPTTPRPPASRTTTTEGNTTMDDQMTLDGAPAPQPAKRAKRATTAEEAALNGRAGKVTDAWTATQPAGLVSASRRTSVHQLVKRVLAARQFGEDTVQAALLRLAGRGIAPTAAALGRELTQPNGNGQAPAGHRPARLTADHSKYDRRVTDAR